MRWQSNRWFLAKSNITYGTFWRSNQKLLKCFIFQTIHLPSFELRQLRSLPDVEGVSLKFQWLERHRARRSVKCDVTSRRDKSQISNWHPYLAQSPFCVLPFQGFFKPTSRKKTTNTVNPSVWRVCWTFWGLTRNIYTLFWVRLRDGSPRLIMCVFKF